MTTNDLDFKLRYGPWALIAGGSEGIGRSFAVQLAARGINLLLVARNTGPLQELATQLRREHGVQVVTESLDLTAEDLDQRVESLIASREVGLLVYNAGATHGAGMFLDEPLSKALNVVRLNCVGPLLLTHKLGVRMKDRGRGGVILMGSMAGLAGMGFCAAYAATKSFDITLAESLWFEFGTAGVDVLGLIAGATATPAMRRSGLQFGQSSEQDVSTQSQAPRPNTQAMESDDVAREALEHLGRGPIWIAGAHNRAAAHSLRNAPRDEVVRAMTAAAAGMFGLPVPEFRAPVISE